MGASSPLPSAGWYADPHSAGQLRWWSGGGWTHHVAPLPAPLPPSAPPPPTRPAPQQSSLPPIDSGVPGASARAEYERRRAKREQKLEATWGDGHLGKLAKKLSDDPRSTASWAKGAEGEVKVAQVLHKRIGNRAVILHDRSLPGTRANVDHLVIAPNGVWVIDSKRYRGKVERRDVGRMFRRDERLFVGGRDRSNLVEGMSWQVEAVRMALGDASLPMHACLTFVGAEWSLFAKPFQLDGVWITWPKKLATLALQPGPLGGKHIDHIARTLAHRLPSK